MYLNNASIYNIGFLDVASSVSDTILASLTATSSITAYNAAATNSWVKVTGGEYAKVQILAGAVTYGMNNTQFLGTATGASFNATLTVALSSNTSTALPIGTYLIGFATRIGATNTAITSYPLVGSSYLSGTYTSVGSASYTSPATSINNYFVRKAPTSSLPVSGYIAYGGYPSTGSYSYLATGATTWPNAAAYSTTQFNTDHSVASAGPTWTPYTNNLPFFQVLGTTTKGW